MRSSDQPAGLTAWSDEPYDPPAMNAFEHAYPFGYWYWFPGLARGPGRA